jgi:hypothetical protein
MVFMQNYQMQYHEKIVMKNLNNIHVLSYSTPKLLAAAAEPSASARMYHSNASLCDLGNASSPASEWRVSGRESSVF